MTGIQKYDDKPPVHADDAVVDRFASALKDQLAATRAKRGGSWDASLGTQQRLSDMLREQVEKGDPLDVGVLSMFLWSRCESIAASAPSESAFQARVQPWLVACFVESVENGERNHRFLEEALELVQACGCTQSEAHQLVHYVYGRPVGQPHQEVGGVMLTLAALCLGQGLEMHTNGETELKRVWTQVEEIRAKQATKPKHLPLPEVLPKRPSTTLNYRRIARDLERTAIGYRHYDYALRMAKDFQFLDAADRALLDRYATGTANDVDRGGLMEIAKRVAVAL